MMPFSSRSRRDRLVDERFVRALSDEERSELELHLLASPTAAERYRRLHLLERVTALGPERALDEPSSIEIDRIAADLGLLESAPPARSLLRWLAPLRVLGFSMAAAAAVGGLWMVVPTSETVMERGVAPTAVSVSVYVVSPSGEIRLHDGSALNAADHLKLRLSNASENATSLQTVATIIVDASGGTSIASLVAPEFNGNLATVPGAVSLTGMADGEATMFVVLSEGQLDAEQLVSTDMTEASVRKRAGDGATVHRISLSVGTGDGPSP